ncbi:MAG TPA: OsmC family protein [Caulobacteraceae bacterium]|jgi:organic hydroperoxide reductase OsmC/OhrA
MPAHEHAYAVDLKWTGAGAEGTSSYAAYARDHRLSAPGKPPIPGSSDPAFRGDPARWNPEDLLVASLSSCHMLWYLGLCAGRGVRVTAYADSAQGWMRDEGQAGGQFTRVLLRPRVTLAPGSDLELARRLHHDANAKCFIARSVNFPVEHEPAVEIAP